jgi:hypothetical protein
MMFLIGVVAWVHTHPLEHVQNILNELQLKIPEDYASKEAVIFDLLHKQHAA